MRRVLSLALAILCIISIGAATAHAARVSQLRVTSPSWEQWIEQGAPRQGHLGVWEQTGCSPAEPRLSYTLSRTTEDPASTVPARVGYFGYLIPLALGPKVAGAGQMHELGFGPVSVLMHEVFYGQSGRDPDNSPINQIGRWVLTVNVNPGGPGDVFRNWRNVNYRGVKKPAGACAAAGLDTYNVLAAAPPA